MRTLVTLLGLLLTTPCFGLDVQTIRDIAQKPHSRDGLLPQLEIYPDARAYEVAVRSGKPGADLADAPKVSAKEKTVEGKYLVTEFQPHGGSSPVIMVVTYDEDAGAFRKWVLGPGGTLGESIGTHTPATRSISWISTNQSHGAAIQVLTSEVHTDGGSSWREIVLNGAKVIYITEGIARRIR